MSANILDWASAAAVGPTRAGGKGWHLGALAQLGVPVPPGFVIDAATSAGHKQGDPLPPVFVTALEQELKDRNWSDVALAVRSSAALEDSARASFAGIYRSCLNVRGLEATLRAIVSVWDSSWTPAAVAYRQRFGIGELDGTMAVVVMPLLPAVASGIAFTCDPISGREDQMLIHAHWGLGEALVGGQVDGDEYRLQEDYRVESLSLIDQRQGAKARITVAAPHGGIQLCDTPEALKSKAVLSADQVIALGELVREVAFALDYTNARYDVEWVFDGSAFWIVQARPITACGRLTYGALRNQPALWSRGNSRDVAPDPLSPLDWSLSRTLLNRMITRPYAVAGYDVLSGIQRAALRYGRLYFETAVLQWEAFDCFGADPKASNQFIGGHQPEIAVPKPTTSDRLARVRRSLRYILRIGKHRGRAAAALADARKQAAHWLAKSPPTNNVELAHELSDQIAVIRRADDLFLLQVSSSALFGLVDLVERYCPGEGLALGASLMIGGDPTVTAAQGYGLLDLAGVAATDTEALAWLRRPDRIGTHWSHELREDSSFRQAFEDFLGRYGHRTVYESYLRNPRWREAPDYLLDNIVNLIGSEMAPLRARQNQAFALAVARVKESLPFWLRPLLPKLIRFAIVERNHREAARSALMAYLEVIRRGVLILGQRFASAGALELAEDIFNLTSLEVFAVAQGRLPMAAAARRAARRRRQLEKWSLDEGPELILEQGEESPRTVPVVEGLATGPGNFWQGTVVANGQARGIAFVARHPTEALSMNHGGVLVAPSTDPSWTPLFLKAGALVMETGGYLSHGAIVAREFGIPAVVNLPNILNEIRTGNQLEVDGSRGTIRRL